MKSQRTGNQPMQLLRCLQKLWLIGAVLLFTEPAFATQAHSAPEGLYAHQLAHIFFIISIGVLIYWLRERKLVQAVGWRYIQYAALFFILWNLDAFSVHLLEEQIAVIDVQRIDPWKIWLPNAPGNWAFRNTNTAGFLKCRGI
jgi:hypothetical protein